MGITNMETILAHLLKVEEYFQKWKETVPLSMKKALKEQLHKNPNYRKAVTLRPCMYWSLIALASDLDEMTTHRSSKVTSTSSSFLKVI